MSADASTIWSYPKGGAVPDLTQQLEALDLAELFRVSAPLQSRATGAVEVGRDRAAAGARDDAARTNCRANRLVVKRMIRGSFLERALKWWSGFATDWRNRSAAETDAVPEELVAGLHSASRADRSHYHAV